MNDRMWARRILLKYTLLQLPAIAILLLFLSLARQLAQIPSWLMWGLIGLWIAKDVILYPFVWRAYDWGHNEERNPMIGLRGVAEDRLDPLGYILVGGELWKAEVIEDSPAIEKGANVVVRGVRGLTLLVGHASEEMSSDQNSVYK